MKNNKRELQEIVVNREVQEKEKEKETEVERRKKKENHGIKEDDFHPSSLVLWFTLVSVTFVVIHFTVWA